MQHYHQFSFISEHFDNGKGFRHPTPNTVTRLITDSVNGQIVYITYGGDSCSSTALTPHLVALDPVSATFHQAIAATLCLIHDTQG